MKYDHLWKRRDLKRGTFWVFNNLRQVRVHVDHCNRNELFHVIQHSER